MLHLSGTVTLFSRSEVSKAVITSTTGKSGHCIIRIVLTNQTEIPKVMSGPKGSCKMSTSIVAGVDDIPCLDCFLATCYSVKNMRIISATNPVTLQKSRLNMLPDQ